MILPHRVGFRCHRRRPLFSRRWYGSTASNSSALVPQLSPRRIAILIAAIIISLSFFLVYKSTTDYTIRFSFPSSILNSFLPVPLSLERVLKSAAMENNKTVILTSVNEAWAGDKSVIDLFLESFRIGEGTHWLLNHLVIIALDQNAFTRCLLLHTHCYALVTEEDEGLDGFHHEEAYFMTPHYLKIMWTRIDFLRSVLDLGYNFVFTDADIMWFRDPFPRFYADADFQIACDHFSGNSDDLQNSPNAGFNYVKSNNRSIEFYKFWYSSREMYPENHDQDVLNKIKFDPFITDIGLKIKFLDTAYFGGLCEPSKDLNLVCTMHANCCFGLDTKLNDLRVMLQDWKNFTSLSPSLKSSSHFSWNVPQNCSLSSLRHYNSTGESVQQGSKG